MAQELRLGVGVKLQKLKLSTHWHKGLIISVTGSGATVQIPRPLQSFLQMVDLHVAPRKPCLQRHTPMRQRPPLAHGCLQLQSRFPYQPGLHRQVPCMLHTPCSSQPGKHCLISQAMPVKPGAHVHRSWSHTPWLEQLATQPLTGKEQSSPVKP